MIEADEERYRLTIPLTDAIPFAIGDSDLGYAEPSDELRQLIGLLVIDALEYSEQWRSAALVRGCLQQKWPDLLR
jgi:hypothetical protein